MWSCSAWVLKSASRRADWSTSRNCRWPTGYLYAGTNWVVCQFPGADNPRFGTSHHNHYWLLTQGDVGYNGSDAWGYIPATVVSYGGNEQPIPGVPPCSNGGWY
jgi:hypothetical protein